jgi:peptide/nickel transport system ATP-binding protein
MSDIILETKELEISFYNNGIENKAVEGINFSLSRGEVLGIVGESGSGKSVTSLAIMQLLQIPPCKIKKGEILFYDDHCVDLLKLNQKEINLYRGRKISMIFQEPMTSLNPVLTCGFQVKESLMMNYKIDKNEAIRRSIALFDEVELPEPEKLFYKYPYQVSGGQKQRVMIAMAISCSPSILIADEPTTALDVIVQKNILTLLKKLQKKHEMSIIFITHDLGIVSEIANRILVMYKGKIVEQGITEDILKYPVHPYTKGLLACKPSLEFRQKRLTTVYDSMKTDNEGRIYFYESPLKQIIVNAGERKAFHEKIYNEPPILTIRNLDVQYSANSSIIGRSNEYFKAVNHLSFDVYHGETLGLVGGSGCGKTTLGRAILKLVDSTNGDIIYKGRNLNRLKTHEMRKIRKNIQIIFQDPYSSLNPRMTIGQIISEPMIVHKLFKTKKERENKVLELLMKVSLDESHYYRYPHEFSGGQRQRIGIARALSLNPEFIICDESVSALDVSIQAQILNLLNDLKQEFDLTYIFISHDLSVVKYMSDRIIVMNHGDIEEINEADELYKSPKSEYTKTLINSIPSISNRN